jgi:hypothetical protein
MGKQFSRILFFHNRTKSKQLLFYLMPQEIHQIEAYLKEQNWVFLPSQGHQYPFEPLSHLADFTIVSRPQDLGEMHTWAVPEKNKYAINYAESAVIQLIAPRLDTAQKKLKYGRLYYQKEYVQNNEIQSKNQDFLNAAEDFFKWFRKFFKKAALENYPNFYVSVQVKDWLQKEQGELTD